MSWKTDRPLTLVGLPDPDGSQTAHLGPAAMRPKVSHSRFPGSFLKPGTHSGLDARQPGGHNLIKIYSSIESLGPLQHFREL